MEKTRNFSIVLVILLAIGFEVFSLFKSYQINNPMYEICIIESEYSVNTCYKTNSYVRDKKEEYIYFVTINNIHVRLRKHKIKKL